MAFHFASLIISISLVVVFVSEIKSKVYERCELALELRDVYEFPSEQLSTWVCIANYESHYNTSAYNPGSGDHGLFQISELFWCSPNGDLACAVKCTDLKDDDIEDDVICAKRIFRQHKRISGDGFTAWVVYNLYCNNKAHADTFLKGCFSENSLAKYQNEIGTTAEEPTTKGQNGKSSSDTTYEGSTSRKPTLITKTTPKVSTTTIEPKEGRSSKARYALTNKAKVSSTSRTTPKLSETTSRLLSNNLFLQNFATTYKGTDKLVLTSVAKVPITITSKPKERHSTAVTNKVKYTTPYALTKVTGGTSKTTPNEGENKKSRASFSSPNNLFLPKFSTPKIEQRTSGNSHHSIRSFVFKNKEESDKTTNIRARETDENAIKLKSHEKLYALVNKPDYTYQITSHGFRFFRTV